MLVNSDDCILNNFYDHGVRVFVTLVSTFSHKLGLVSLRHAPKLEIVT
jgi:hypothetical protein